MVKGIEEFDSLFQLVDYFKDERTCLQYIEEIVWGGVPYCPHCGLDKVYRFSCGKRWKCSKCKKQFTVKIGTIFEHSPIPLRKWIMAIYLLVNNKKGISSIQLGKHIGVSRQSAWFMAHRIRSTMNQGGVKLEGIVQSDETFVGGKNKNRHIDKKVKNARNSSDRIFKDKSTVLGMIDDSGKAKTVVIPSSNAKYIKDEILKTVKPKSVWVTDNFFSDAFLGRKYQREVVNHHQKKYFSDGGFTTNAIENVWSHLKRMIIGVYHFVSRKHLQKYCDEHTFRFNTKGLKQGERLKLALSNINYRMTYKQLIHG